MGKAKCAQCRTEYDKKRYGQNRRRILEHVRLYQDEHKEVIRERKHLYAIKNHDKIRLQSKKFRANNPAQIKAERVIAHGNRRGKNLYPLAPFCELCPDDEKRTEKLEHAHLDYEYPTIYVTACRDCHAFADFGLIEI